METLSLAEAMSHCYGTESYHSLTNCIFGPTKVTDGVMTFINVGKAWWAISDSLLFLLQERQRNPRDFYAVHINSKDNKADIIIADGDDKELYKRHYSYTDLESGSYTFFYFTSEDLLIYSGEY